MKLRMVFFGALVLASANSLSQDIKPEPPKPLVCRECGVVESVREVEKRGDASGAGAVAGGVAGAVIGRELGSRRHRGTGTVLGAVGGAVAGHQIEKHVRTERHWEVWVRFEDGAARPVIQDMPPAWRTGDRVRLVNGVLSAN